MGLYGRQARGWGSLLDDLQYDLAYTQWTGRQVFDCRLTIQRMMSQRPRAMHTMLERVFFPILCSFALSEPSLVKDRVERVRRAAPPRSGPAFANEDLAACRSFSGSVPSCEHLENTLCATRTAGFAFNSARSQVFVRVSDYTNTRCNA